MKEELEKFKTVQKGKVSLPLHDPMIVHSIWILSTDLQKCISSKSTLDGQIIENQNVKDVST